MKDNLHRIRLTLMFLSNPYKSALPIAMAESLVVLCAGSAPTRDTGTRKEERDRRAREMGWEWEAIT